MPRYSIFPTLLDEVKQISITKLKEFGFMDPDSFKSGQLTWSRRRQEIGSINIFVYLQESPFAELSYTYNKEEQIKYKVDLVSVESNLGIGRIWYFVCPHTGKRCRKLYGAGKYFLHRDAYPDAMYECQTYSKRGRQIDKVCRIMHGEEKLFNELYSKHFKTHYAGKPTRRYKLILSKIEYYRQNHEQAFKIFEQELHK
jgi:hypothetical protein